MRSGVDAKTLSGILGHTNAQGKREVHTVYAKTKEECEVRLETMIAEVRERIKEEKQRVKDASGGSEDVPE